MSLRFLAISDTHLGEGTSLLTFPQGRQHLLTALYNEFGIRNIQELILVGDAIDTALASMSQVITHINAFINTLRSSINIDRIIYVPGNHDHTVWTDYMNARYPGVNNHHTTPPDGELLVDSGNVQCRQACEDLATIFFEHDYGPAWLRILADANAGNNFNFVIANPIYAVEEFGRSYVFTHGTHFKSIVATPEWMKKLVHWTRLDRLLAKIEIDPNCDVRNANNLEELEEEIAGFVDSLWISSLNDPISRSDQLWYLYTVVSSHFEEHRSIPNINERMTYPNFNYARINQLDRNNKSIDLFLTHFFRHLRNHLIANNLGANNLTFVYGDTHDGGFGEINESGSNIRIYNCGSWVAHHEDDHPPCHLFAVDDTGSEYLYDISFNNVSIINRPIIGLAAADFENCREAIGWLVRWFLERFG